jgi:hypothetical protein
MIHPIRVPEISAVEDICFGVNYNNGNVLYSHTR